MNNTDILSAMHNTIEVYHMLCKPVCKRYGLAQTSLDILMFLANNPRYTTATDIIKYRGIQANLVSVHVDALVAKGLLVREPVLGNRRSIRLICTEQAGAVIQDGRRAQEEFFHTACGEISPDEMTAFRGVMEKIALNIVEAKDCLKKEEKLK